MKRQNKRSLYESIMRDVARVVKRRLNEEDEQTNMSVKKITKLSEIPFEYLLNPELNEDFVRKYPTFFKLNNNGKIGMCVYKASDFDEVKAKYNFSSNKSRYDFMSPLLTFYEDNVATLLAKAEYINQMIRDDDYYHLFKTRCEQFVRLFSSKNSIPNKFDKFLEAYKREIEKYKSSIWFSKLSKSSHRNLDKKTIIDFFGNFVKIHISSEIL